MTTCDPEARLAQWIESIGHARSVQPAPPAPPGTDAVLMELCWSYLVWDAGFAQAAGAVSRIFDEVFDFNELRVCTPDEVVGLLGTRYPKGPERAQRLLASLRAIFLLENGLTLARMLEIGKREARAYLDSLDGVPRFVSSRVMLLALGGHALPIDDRLCAYLEDAGLVEPGTAPEAAAAWLERRVRAGDAPSVYATLEAAVARDGTPPHKASPRRERSKTSSARATSRRSAGER
ncbi:MAG: hypothetical protein H6811_05590 [Phycisphaeraceae bacterium]|nr:hypothetical protein [Phycisphaeraceae bacterium]